MSIIAFDTETTGLDPWHGCLPFIVSAIDENNSYRLWRFQVDGVTREVSAPNSEKLEIADMLREADLLIGHNVKFDLRMLEKLGIPLPRDVWEKTHDTIIASHCLHSAGPHGLKELALTHLDILDDDQEELRKAALTCRRHADKLGWRQAKPCDPHWPTMKTGQEWWMADCWMPGQIHSQRDQLWEIFDLTWVLDEWATSEDGRRLGVCEKYAVRDVERTMGLYLFFQERLKAEGLEYQYEKRRQLLREYYRAESRGMTLRKFLCPGVEKKHYTLAAEHEKNCFQAVDNCINNLDSPKQLQNAMYNVIGLPIVKRTETGQPSTDKYVIEELKQTLRRNSQGEWFIRNLAAWRKRDHAADAVNRYSRGALEYDDPRQSKFSCLHINCNPTGTDTTRSSSEGGQNIAKGEGLPKEEKFNLRDLFGPALGRIWYSHDYNNQEMRIFAYSAEERELIEAFERGEAVHLIIARELYPSEYAACERDGVSFKDRYKATLYQWVKNGNFSLIYGAGEKKADLTYHLQGAYRRIRRRFKQIDRFMRAMYDQAKQYGYITCLGGYRLQVPLDGPHKAVNYYVQGSAGWAMGLAMDRVGDYLDEIDARQISRPNTGAFCDCQYYMIMNVHDELLHDVPEQHDPWFPWKIKELMEKSGDDLGIPLPCEMSKIRISWDQSEDVPLPAVEGFSPVSKNPHRALMSTKGPPRPIKIA